MEIRGYTATRHFMNNYIIPRRCLLHRRRDIGRFGTAPRQEGSMVFQDLSSCGVVWGTDLDGALPRNWLALVSDDREVMPGAGSVGATVARR